MPRKKHSFSTRRRSHSAPARLSPRKPKTRKECHDDSMKAAIHAVEEGQSISNAARDHGVPKTTLYDRISGKIMHGVNPGPTPYLSNEEDKELGSYLKQCSKIGCGKTRRDVVAIVQNIASDKGVLRTSQVSSGWWHGFLKTNQDLSLRQGKCHRTCSNGDNEQWDDGTLFCLFDGDARGLQSGWPTCPDIQRR